MMLSRLIQVSIVRDAPGCMLGLSGGQAIAGVLLLLLIPAGAAWGQSTCPFDEGDVVADTLDPKGYYPLQVGNVWEYVSDEFGFNRSIWREEIVADTLIDNTRFYIRNTTRFETQLENNPPITEVSSILRSYIAITDSSIFFWLEDGKAREDEVRFNQDFNSCYKGYLVGGSLVIVGGEYSGEFDVEEDIERVFYKVEAIKVFAGVGGSLHYGYGIGIVRAFGDPYATTNLVYAKVGNQELGIPLDERFSIIASAKPAPILRGSRLDFYPNPVYSLTYLTLTLAQPGDITVRIYDVLGRLVATPVEGVYLSARTHTVAWNAESMAPGIYVARLTVEGRSAARAQLVVVH